MLPPPFPYLVLYNPIWTKRNEDEYYDSPVIPVWTINYLSDSYKVILQLYPTIKIL